MNKRLFAVRQRRGELLGIVSAQRVTLAESAKPLQKALAVADKGWEVLAYLRHHPLWLAGISGLVLLRWRKLSGWIKWGGLLWRGYRIFAGAKHKLNRETAPQRL